MGTGIRKSKDTGLVHRVVCLFTPQLLLVLIEPTHGGIGQAELTWVAGYVPRRSPIQVLTRPGTE